MYSSSVSAGIANNTSALYHVLNINKIITTAW